MQTSDALVLEGDEVERKGRQRQVGKPLKRKEDPILITGSGSFVDDIKFPRILHAAILRSSYAHARIKNVDLSEALRSQGVVFATSGEHIKNTTKPLPEVGPPNSSKTVDVYMLAVEKVHYTGEPVAVVVAESRYAAEDALEKITIEYEPLDAVVDVEKAIEPTSPRIYEEWESNEGVSFEIKTGNPGDALAHSDFVFKEKVVRHRYTAAPLETRVYLASYDSHSGNLTYYASTQMPHIFRTLLSRSVNIPENKIRVIAPNVGGAFGQKAPVYQEEPLIGLLSILTGRPVKWVETRSENLRAGSHSRQQVHYVEIGLMSDGKITAIRDRMLVDYGAYLPQPGLGSVFATASLIPSGYRIRNYEVLVSAVHTTKAPFGALRGYGKADSNFVMETVLDSVARKLKMDPVALRLNNLIRPDEFPYESCTGKIYDNGDYPRALLKAAEMIRYYEFKKSQERLRNKGRFKGISVSFLIEPSASVVKGTLYNGYESARIVVDPSGKLTVFCGASAQGQSHETALSQVVSDYVGVVPDDIVVYEGDTQSIPYGLGAWSSRFSIAGVGAVILACEKVRRKLLAISSVMLSSPLRELAIQSGHIYSKTDPNRKVSIAEVANFAYTQIYLLPQGMEPGIDETARYVLDPSGYPAWSYGAYGVIVDVDIETGKIDIEKQVFVSDCGNIINPQTLDGQVIGGIAQGIGGAVFEELPYDNEGQLLASTFMDYLLPTSLDIPINLELHHMVTPSPKTLGGFKGAAEGGCIVPPYGLTNAVLDALAPLGVMRIAQPLSPQNIWASIHEKKGLNL